MQKSDSPVIYLKDYKKPEFVFESTNLDIRLDFSTTEITATHKVSRQSLDSDSAGVTLDCERMEIRSIEIDGIELEIDQFVINDSSLTIHQVPDQFELIIRNNIDPSQNTSLSGLYQSGDMLCTQCEAEGYRRITPAYDRPDSLCIYSVKLTANKTQFPVLLSNGNLIESVNNNDNTHTTVWHDPFPKPTYLFAIVAGDLECLEDKFVTQSGRSVDLRFYARGKDILKCHHAMESLKRSMTWDEEKYGREYDLDLFNVVAVEDFNMGAMENKSLNVFNTKYVLADTAMATDTDFDNVEAVIGHEYFHNWSGNRVTCRDWFQLSLKEGFTVFRDQEFSADMGSRGVKRINDANVLRSHQFKEDASPMAHPVRPASYQEINNFYTVTIYNKGAEVVRMIHTILGEKNFRKGTDLYFDRHDGQAVTTDDFIKAMEDANLIDLNQFKNWYSQAGTPEVSISTQFDEDKKQLTIHATQFCPETPDQKDKAPFVIPLKTAFFDNKGNKLNTTNDQSESMLILDQQTQSFTFDNFTEAPLVSYLREFSAPIKLDSEQSKQDRLFLLEHDDDAFSQWEAGHSLFVEEVIQGYNQIGKNKPFEINSELVRVVQSLLTTDIPDPAFLAQVLTLPAFSYLSELVEPIDPLRIHQSRENLKHNLASNCESELIKCIENCEQTNKGDAEPEQMASRSLRDTCLGLLSVLDNQASRDISEQLFHNPGCMTDESIALAVISISERQDKTDLMDEFYNRWHNEPLVIDKWLRSQSTAPLTNTLENVRALTQHPGFDFKNPNKVYALILGFTHGNPVSFHAENGEGYAFLREWAAILDPINPQVTARLVTALSGWNKYTPVLRDQMKLTLQDIEKIENLSRDVKEIISKNLQS